MDLVALQVVRSKDGEGTQLGLGCAQLLSQSGVYILPSFTLSFLLLMAVVMENQESHSLPPSLPHLLISHNLIQTSEEVNGYVLLTLVYRLCQCLRHSDKPLSFVA